MVAKNNADRINKEKEDKKKQQKIEFRSGLEVQFKVHDKVDLEKKTSKKDDFVDINQKQKKYMDEQIKKMEMEAQRKLEERQMREAEMEGVKKKRDAIKQAELDEQTAELKRLRNIMEEEMRNAARKKSEVWFAHFTFYMSFKYSEINSFFLYSKLKSWVPGKKRMRSTRKSKKQMKKKSKKMKLSSPSKCYFAVFLFYLLRIAFPSQIGLLSQRWKSKNVQE